MAGLLPYTKVYLGDVPATELHEGPRGWPAAAATGLRQVVIRYGDHLHYDQPVFYDGLMMPQDVDADVGPTRQFRDVTVGETRSSVTVGETRVWPRSGPTRSGRRVLRSEPTRVVRHDWLTIAPTRLGSDPEPTRRSVAIGPTRVKRGK